jgi:hypothetical protein
MSRSFSQAHQFPRFFAGAVLTALFAIPAVAGAAPITFTDIASDPGSGITYRRGKSVTDATFDAIKLLPFLAIEEISKTPEKARGAPGVALLDYDRDGDLDVYVTNGPGRANSLYQNRFAQTGVVSFVDVALAAGVGAADQDSTGVCYGDIDNDGDQDLLVLGRMESNRLFRNEGNGTFSDITGAAGVGGGNLGHTSCTMGDVNGDGLLDIFVGNSFDWLRRTGIFVEWFGFNHQNQFYLNQGGNTFVERSQEAGLQVLQNTPAGDGTMTWAVAMVDYDQDGDLDIMHADDQGALATGGFAGIDRGLIQIFQNDGEGNFLNVTEAAGLSRMSAPWMGFSYGDLDHDGNLDMFVPSVGDYMVQQFGIPIPPGLYASRHFFGTPTGAFVPGDLSPFNGILPFGWGNGMTDYDNDGDTDIIFYGSLDVVAFYSADNPGVVLQNDGRGVLSWDQGATAATAEFVTRQNVQGMAVGDLNDDGFPDMVHVSAAYFPPSLPLVHSNVKWGSVFDAAAFVLPTFSPIGPMEFEWNGIQPEDGFLGVELNSANNGNRGVKIGVRGTVGLTSLGKVNRDGIGAIVRFTPRRGKTAVSPVLGGSSYASQHSLVQSFGLGTRNDGTVDILWPGGTRNRLYDVQAGESLTLPEIPCDIGMNASSSVYRACVDGALGELVANGTITNSFATRLRKSAVRAFGRI